MPNPGDAGSSIGCVLAKKKQFMEFTHAYTGHDITGDYPVETVIRELKAKKSQPLPVVEQNLARGLSETEAFLLILGE